MEKKEQLVNKGNHEILDNFFYPYFHKIVKYIPAWITPNQLTIIGFMGGLLSCFSLLFVTAKFGLILACLFLIFQYVFDSLDGLHARNTSQSSRFGAFYDHFFDIIFSNFLLFAIGVRFDMISPLFFFLFLTNSAFYSAVFLSYATTGVLYIPPLGGVFQILLIIVTLMITYFWDIHISLGHYITNDYLKSIIDSSSLDNLNLPKIICLLFYVVLPYSFIDTYRRNKKILLS